jgi:hypothetical protein
MRKTVAVSLLALALWAGFTADADAQRRRGLRDVTARGGRHGFWLNLGVGAGTESFRFADENDYSEGLTKPTLDLRLGGTVSSSLRLGVEGTLWSDTYTDDVGDRVREYLGGLMLIGQFYPARDLGLFIKGGAGVSRSGVDVVGPFDSHEDGFAWSAGLGYEIRLSRSLFLTPTLDLMQHRSEQRDDLGGTLPALHERLATFGVALTIQPGR